MKLKIVIVIDNLIKGGKERRLVELLNGFSSNYPVVAKLVLLKNQIDYPEIYDLPDVDVHILDRKIKKDPRVFFKLYKICSDFKPDIIHSWGSMPSVYALPIAKFCRIKFINAMISNAVCEKGSKSWVRAKLTFPFSDVIVSNSKAGIIAHNAPWEKSKVIHNGFNFNRVSNIESKKEIWERFSITTRFIVGMVGAFHDRKDYTTLIQAANKILNRRDDITFVLVGTGPNLESSKQMVEKISKDKIKFLGQQNEVESIINVFDIGVLTTNDLVHKEGVSNSIMEYMALNKPVIATDGGGTNEIVLSNKTGFIIKPGDYQQLVDKIEFLIDHPDIAIEMGKQGKIRVIEEFGIEKMVKSTYELYQKLIVQ